MRRKSVGLGALLSVALLVIFGGTAHADGQATISSVARGADGTVSGILTVRPVNDQSAVVDARSLTMTVAGKEYSVQGQPASRVERSAILLIDRSGSMRTSGMATVRASVDQFLHGVPRDVKVGVVSFADQPTLDVAPTLDHRAVQAAVDALQSAGDTALYDGLNLAIDTLGTTGERSILLLSDGKDTASTMGAQPAEQKLKTSGIQVQVIAFNTSSTDQLALGYLAAAGQGAVTAVENSVKVGEAFSSAAKALESQVSWSAKVGEQLSGRNDVTLRGTANGVPFTAISAVDFGTAPATPTDSPSTSVLPPASAGGALPGAAPPDASFLGMSSRTVMGLPMPVVVAALLVFVGLFLLMSGLLSPAFKSARRERVDSIDKYVTQPDRRAPEPARTTSVSNLAEQLVNLGDRVVEGRESTPRTVLLLQRADLPWRAGEWAVLRLICFVVSVLLGVLLLHRTVMLTILGVVLGVVVGLILPSLVLKALAARRARKFEQQLPDVLTLVASSLSTGFSLPQALDAVAHDVAEPAAKEFSRAMAETRIGSDLSEALTRLSDRMDSRNMRWAAMAIEIQRTVGGNLAGTLRTTASTLREREALFRQVRALSAEGRLSAWILAALPIVIFFWLLWINFDYISSLWRSPLGIALVAVALILLTIGVFWMRKVVEVKV
jgi:tight adherence protein B